PVRRRILRVKQIGESSYLAESAVDRRVDVVANLFGIGAIVQRRPDAHDAQAGGDQMLTGRIVQIGCDPLLNVLLDGYELRAHVGTGTGRCVDGVRLFVQRPMATNQPYCNARIRITDRSNDGFDVSSGSAESEAMMDPYLNTFRETGMESLAQGTRI